ncbi:DMT family transporter, partial [Streptomyces sp. NTH33]|uniref:DMT family transporter n=1 Tax=Streptomyces sp. NTH33 TaxID=1735453 RepID=UPI0021AD22E7
LALVNTALAYWLWFRGIGRLSATQVTFLGPLSPLTAAVLGWAALGQSLTPLQLTGMALAFGATVAGQSATARRPPAPATAPHPPTGRPRGHAREGEPASRVPHP